jgi:oligopeptidase A
MQHEASADSLAKLEQQAAYGSISHLPVWRAIEAEDVEPGIRQLLRETASAFEALEGKLEAGRDPKSVSWDAVMAPTERLNVRLGQVLGPVIHLTSVKYSDALQEAWDAVRPEYVRLSNRMSQSRPLYHAMTALRDGPEWPQLSQARQRILTEYIRGMERSGVHLEGAARERYQEIDERLSKLSNDFQTNLVKEEKSERVKVRDAEQVHGVPGPVLAMAAKQAGDDGETGATPEKGPWHFVVNGVNYLAVLQHCESRTLREELYRAFRFRGTRDPFDNRPLLEEMLRLRQEQARLVGFASYAELSIDAKMASSPDDVWRLLEQLETWTRPAAEREFAELRAFMAEQGAPEADDPRPWDVPYWTEKLREARYDYDTEALREYFQMPRVLDGLFDLVSKLYDVKISPVEAAAVPVWDESVSFFEVLRGGAVIAGFYVDPYARPGEKRGGAWMNTVVGRNRLLAQPGQTASLPVALFVMNGRPPSEGRPGLMSLEEVRTLFHEFGHATQHMFTQVDEGGAAGMNLVEWDAVELASQFNEYWMEYKPFLRNLSCHVETGEPLDDATLDRIIDSRNFMVGNFTLRQLAFGKTDMALHQRYGLADGDDGETPFDLERRIARETLVTPMLADETQLPAFGHLFAGGYAAGYYSYKWAEVLAADAFAAFREVGLDNERGLRDVAGRFRDTVLALGGSLPAAEVYRRFRGRDATADALLEDQGLKPPEAA